MKFSRYQHVERLGTDEVAGILDGVVYVFPKLDGANAQVWMEEDVVRCGTRNNPLEYANASGWGALYDYVLYHAGILAFMHMHPELRLYGEWLIPHTLRTYVESAWNKFYVFDVYANELPLPYNTYKPMLDECGIEYIPCIATVENGTPEIFDELVTKNTYLIQEGKGIGEGLVIKRYDFVNKYGRTVWAKRVTNEFKYGHFKAMGAPILKGGTVIEEVIVNNYVTLDMIEKECAKIRLDRTGVSAPDDAAYIHWDTTWIPQLLGCVYHTLVTEELWHALKKYKAHPVIDFKVLNRFTIARVKELMPTLF